MKSVARPLPARACQVYQPYQPYQPYLPTNLPAYLLLLLLLIFIIHPQLGIPKWGSLNGDPQLGIPNLGSPIGGSPIGDPQFSYIDFASSHNCWLQPCNGRPAFYFYIIFNWGVTPPIYNTNSTVISSIHRS